MRGGGGGGGGGAGGGKIPGPQWGPGLLSHALF